MRLRTSSAVQTRDQPLMILESSMYFRNFSVALVSAAVASGVWFAFRGNPASETGASTNITSSSSSGSIPGYFGTNNALHNSPKSATGITTTEQAAESTRRALVVENGQFFTGDIVGDQPLTKEAGDGRLVVEMYTPEQATEKLRQNEESYAVGRGQGVVRYDVVQLASNLPIEDDHAEKIVAVPQDSANTLGETSAADWMFWGVFDGHRSVYTSFKKYIC